MFKMEGRMGVSAGPFSKTLFIESIVAKVFDKILFECFEKCKYMYNRMIFKLMFIFKIMWFSPKGLTP